MTKPVLDQPVARALREALPRTADAALAAIQAEVPAFGPREAHMRDNISAALRLALGTFLRLVEQDGEGQTPLRSATESAYGLGSVEARAGRALDALLAAFRVGGRVSWRELSTVALEHGLPGEPLARLAEALFAFVDRLSAASVTGHADEIAKSGRARERNQERLVKALLDGADVPALLTAAERADWVPGPDVAVALLNDADARAVVPVLPPATLVLPSEDVPGQTVLVVPVLEPARRALLSALAGRSAVVGPARPWYAAGNSFARVRRAAQLPRPGGLLDTESVLLPLVLTADAAALADLRAQVLAPLAGLRAGTAQRLAETLRVWLLHQGRREEVATHLHIHVQTVRYRMDQLRELYGDQLSDPERRAELLVALLVDATGSDDQR